MPLEPSQTHVPNEDATASLPKAAPRPDSITNDRSPWSPTEKQNLAFTRAVITFKDELDNLRDRKSPRTPQIDEKDVIVTPTTPGLFQIEDPFERRIRVLRGIHHALSSVLAIIIAILQAMTYAKYQETKNVPGAWPEKPTLFPTVLLLGVAIMALVFDICSLVAYFMPGKRIAEKAFRLATELHYVITGVKGLAYTIAASVCRAGFSLGGSNDLWGWSCSDKGAEMQNTNNASFNCSGNTAAWALSVISIALEILNVVISLLVQRHEDKGYRAVANEADGSHNSPTARYSVLDSKSDNVHGDLGEMTPKVS